MCLLTEETTEPYCKRCGADSEETAKIFLEPQKINYKEIDIPSLENYAVKEWCGSKTPSYGVTLQNGPKIDLDCLQIMGN